MAVFELAIIVVVFGAMAVVFGLQERAEWRRLEAWADRVLAHERAPATLSFDAPAPPDLRDAA